MATKSGSLVFYNPAIVHVLSDTINLANSGANVFKCLLLTNSYTPDLDHEYISDLTNELAGNGYGRQSLTGITLSQTGGTVKWDADNPEFLAVGGALTARYYVLAHVNLQVDSAAELIGYGLLDDTPGDVVATAGNKITPIWGEGGIFTGQFNDAA